MEDKLISTYLEAILQKISGKVKGYKLYTNDGEELKTNDSNTIYTRGE